MNRHAWLWAALFALLAQVFFAVPGLAAPERSEVKPATNEGVLLMSFREAAAESGVPVEILMAVGYAESRWKDHEGKPSQMNGYGIMHLADNPANRSLERAEQLLGVPREKLKTDIPLNIRGAAAVLREIALRENNGRLPKDLGDWYVPVAKYSGLSDLPAKWYADEVFKIIERGAQRTLDGETVILPPTPVTPRRGIYENVEDPLSLATPDYPGARWVPASSSNYTVANREADGNSIDYVIIHVTQGSYSSAINWFQNPSAKVSAHYVIRSSDGQITQMVQNKDIAWHAGNWNYNVHSIGIEHEGYVSDPAWFTDAMYRASANLTRWLCDRYGIPKTRSRIIGHNEVPGATHTDPGTHWDWNYYMSLVNQSASSEIIVDNATSGRFSASANWQTATWNTQKYGADYRFTNPEPVSDPAWWKVNVPASGAYDIYAWWPANSGYNSNVPYVIKTTSGFQYVHVNQQQNGGKWNFLGTFNLNAGDDWVVGVSRWTSASGYIMADAVKLVRR
ncbi:N-acetylmuramoyl-L-alanine amidase [Staphylospora marina]|uniref:golvesin C-terminal-like domain-containing protein n=1 Tax=Staphylospora marina TaxID=2490858 RepID=UPI000F5BD54E|nr:N-acetylmuramoyl-L-alanine amidase [Staphylospora marina]